MKMFDEQIAYRPNRYPWTQEIIDGLWHIFWTPDEFNFNSDFIQFHNELSPFEQQVIVRCVSAIGQVEIAVKTFWRDIGNTLRHPSLTDMGCVMANNEVIHNQAYARLLDRLGLENAFEEALKEPVVLGRVNYLRKYNNKIYQDERQQFIYAIILFTIFTEYVSLFSQFYIITHFNRFRNVLKDTAQQVQYTRQEETLHAKAGIMIINTLRNEYPELFTEELYERIHKECLDAIEHETNIIDWILQGYEEPNLSSEILVEYVKNRINQSVVEIGGRSVFDIKPHLLERAIWMEEETLGKTKTDFFHKKPVDYTKKSRSFDRSDLF